MAEREEADLFHVNLSWPVLSHHPRLTYLVLPSKQDADARHEAGPDGAEHFSASLPGLTRQSMLLSRQHERPGVLKWKTALCAFCPAAMTSDNDAAKTETAAPAAPGD
jgi:hypothetical protein